MIYTFETVAMQECLQQRTACPMHRTVHLQRIYEQYEESAKD